MREQLTLLLCSEPYWEVPSMTVKLVGISKSGKLSGTHAYVFRS